MSWCWLSLRGLLLAFVGLLGILPAVSARQDADCRGSATERELLACRQSSVARQEVELGALVKRLSDRADELELKRLLANAQSDWLRYRDAECKVRTFESRLGSAAEVYWLSCLSDMNRGRIDDLQKAVASP